ncbi:MAG: hypothetical protein Q7T24_00950 [Deltaproteobacteria bacterium]|nr:hypothetical protein [Deltaproteobacteria bacterium]
MRVFLVILSLVITACAAQTVVEEPVKKELALWQVLQRMEKGQDAISCEDQWFRYSVELERVVKGRFDNVNAVYGQCPIDKAEFLVYDKETSRLISQEAVPQVPCDPCHRR